jgi:hypothetical protein
MRGRVSGLSDVCQSSTLLDYATGVVHLVTPRATPSRPLRRASASQKANGE